MESNSARDLRRQRFLAVQAERKRLDLTREALADVKAGRTHEHAEIELLAASLSVAERRGRR